MGTSTILLVEDEATLRELVHAALTYAGFDVVAMEDGAAGFDAAVRFTPNAIILDVGLPIMNGLELCKKLRATRETATIPIMILSARSDEVDRVLGLESGADDYVVKPFSRAEFIARVHALLRRAQDRSAAKQLRAGAIEMDMERFTVTVDAQPVALTHTEMRLLEHLMGRVGKVCPREQIGTEVLDVGASELGRAVDAHVASLRKKLGERGAMIETVRGVGYRLSDRSA